jgi:hypothetical protein
MGRVIVAVFSVACWFWGKLFEGPPVQAHDPGCALLAGSKRCSCSKTKLNHQ